MTNRLKVMNFVIDFFYHKIKSSSIYRSMYLERTMDAPDAFRKIYGKIFVSVLLKKG